MSERFRVIEQYADNGTFSHWALIDSNDGRELGCDGGEPEDQLLVRDWQWVEKELNALDDEVARLQGILAEIQHDCEHVGSIKHLDNAERRTWTSVANRIKAALTPQAGKGGGA